MNFSNQRTLSLICASLIFITYSNSQMEPSSGLGMIRSDTPPAGSSSVSHGDHSVSKECAISERGPSPKNVLSSYKEGDFVRGDSPPSSGTAMTVSPGKKKGDKKKEEKKPKDLTDLDLLSISDLSQLLNAERYVGLSVGTKILWAVSCVMIFLGILLLIPWN